ncbi:metal ABC transporter substrate-binding protein [Gordonia sp. (in: high G+C Gram-positive bacteria)]|uniref:metal ABC transporter substrate-binding protein n=1 Tax=Gordonia sp. (in: high G+C Gram-positive bacteria) TaxID=84139 RepID=UPI0039E4CB09
MSKPVAWGAALVAAAILLAACAAPTRPTGKPIVVATFTVIADIAANVAGDRLHVESITKAGAEIHGYEPTPGDIRRAAGAALVVNNGLGVDAWFDRFTADLHAPRVTLSDGVAPVPISSGAYAGKPNPHAWMSPRAAEVYVDNLRRAYTAIDPAGADQYRANADSYKARLRAVRDELAADLRTVPADKRALVTCEGAFSYLTRDTGLGEKYIWPVNAEQQATPRQMASAIDFVRDRAIPAVFCESTVSNKPMRQIAKASGARLAGTLYVDSLSTADGPVPTYLDLIRHDARTIAAGLTGSAAR